MSPAQAARQAIRKGEWTGPTAGLAPGFVQANLAVLPAAFAEDFRLFCARNPQACPVLEITAAGSFEPARAAPRADLRTDLPRYRVYRAGALAGEPARAEADWPDGGVAFLLGCSFTFDALLLEHGLPVRHIEESRNVPMYRTNRACAPAGVFAGPLVVSMRPMNLQDAARARELTARFPAVHGAPVHAGDPAALGIRDLGRPDYGDAVTVRPGETPVFWACGVTSQAALEAARPPLALTHAPGYMFITDLRIADVAGGTGRAGD